MAASRGQRVRLARQARKLSQAKLAAAIGVDPRTVRRVEHDQVKDPHNLGLILDFLHLSDSDDEAAPHPVAVADLSDAELRGRIDELINEMAVRMSRAGEVPGRPDVAPQRQPKRRHGDGLT